MLHKLSVQTLQQWVVGSGGWSPVSWWFIFFLLITNVLLLISVFIWLSLQNNISLCLRQLNNEIWRNYFCTAKSFNFLACLTITVFITKSPHHTQSQPQLPNPISQPRKLQIQIQEKDMISGEPPHWWNTLASDWPSQIAFWLVELCHPRSQPTDFQIKIWQKEVITGWPPHWWKQTGSWLVMPGWILIGQAPTFKRSARGLQNQNMTKWSNHWGAFPLVDTYGLIISPAKKPPDFFEWGKTTIGCAVHLQLPACPTPNLPLKTNLYAVKSYENNAALLTAQYFVDNFQALMWSQKTKLSHSICRELNEDFKHTKEKFTLLSNFS